MSWIKDFLDNDRSGLTITFGGETELKLKIKELELENFQLKYILGQVRQQFPEVFDDIQAKKGMTKWKGTMSLLKKDIMV